MIVNVLVATYLGKSKTFHYLVPLELESKIKKGIRVIVPFGNKKVMGFILEIVTEPSDIELKTIETLIDEEPILNEELMNIGEYMSNSLLEPLINCYQAMLPPPLKANLNISVKNKIVKYIKLNININELEETIINTKSIKQKLILEDLLENEITLASSYQSDVIKALEKKKLITIINKDCYRLNNCELITLPLKELTSDQKEVVNKIVFANKTYLLHGVTGSGKTEVYMHLIKKVINNNKTAIMLVPEIALTTQLINRFMLYFGNQIAVLHSKLSDGEKYDEWRKIVNEDAKIVIGTRSAIFAPLKNIGIIIIDEEQITSYKQDNSPRYHAKDIADYRAKHYNCPLVLGSATPTIESYARAKKGYYELLELPNRINSSKLPKVYITDMKNRSKTTYLSDLLSDKITEKLNKKEQIILLLNRRGYQNYLFCQECGHYDKCPHCDITLTYHKSSEMMRCHYCGYAHSKPKECPKCHNEELFTYGLGIEKLEEIITKRWPDARILRMDFDTTRTKNAYQKILNDFSNQEYDILIGTQMVAKGLDFPMVTLVGVINADQSLQIPDFRSRERTYELLSQVAGRAGRADLEGEVIIQTYNPDLSLMDYVRNHDYLAFYLEEVSIRKKLNYPPYTFLTNIKISDKSYELVKQASQRITNDLKRKFNQSCEILGPTINGPLKIKNIYSLNILIKHRDQKDLSFKLQELIENYMIDNKVRIDINFNPN